MRALKQYLKLLEEDIERRKRDLKGLDAEIKSKRRELDRCIEVGMRSLFVPPDSPTCPRCNAVVAVPKPIPDGWSKICPWCGYHFPALNTKAKDPPPPEGAGVVISEDEEKGT